MYSHAHTPSELFTTDPKFDNMKMNRILLGILFVSFFFYACENDDDYYTSDPAPIEFASDISYRVNTTKAAGSSWSNGDKIGVFMKSEGSTLSDQNIVDGASNMSHKTSGNGIFTAETTADAIYFPQDKSKVDFIAYYPYRADITNYIYHVDVSDQSIQENIDLLYSNNLVSASGSNINNSLSFTHQLSTIRFNISIISDDITLDDLTVAASGLKTKANFDLTNGSLTIDENSSAVINLKTTTNSGSAYAEAILLPDNGGEGRQITFSIPSVTTNFKWTIPSETKLEKGRKYTFNIKLDASGVVVEEDFGWIETPRMRNLSDELMYVSHMMSDDKIRNYSMLYDTKYKLAYWVAYPLHSYYLGSSGRNDVWAYDPKIPNNFQPNLKKSYQESNLDRGHQIPSGDRTKDYNTNIKTFYYSNMTAQVGTSFNQSIWAALEGQVRTWTSRCDTMYVVTGAMIITDTDKNIEYAHDASGQQIAKPKYHFKALAQRHGDTYYTLAFKMDNKSYSDKDYNKYRLTVQELEKMTGFEFFPSIPKEAKTQIVSNKWN